MTSTGRGAHLEVARIQSEINRLFEMLLRLREGETAHGSWSPAVDVAETENHLVFEVELPGVDSAGLDLSTQSGSLNLRGERKTPTARSRKENEVLHDERDYGPFEVTIPLTAAVNPREALARMRDGVLRIDLPKVKNRRGAAVPIQIRETVTEKASVKGGVGE